MTLDAERRGPVPRRGRGRPPSPGLEDRRRAQIIAAAVAVFTERGYTDATMADIARHAGIGQGTLYRYVPSKRELLDLVFDYSVEQVVGAAEPALRLDEPPRSPAELLGRFDAAVQALTELFNRRPELLALVAVEAAAMDEELKLRLLGLESTVARMAARLCEDAQDAGLLRAGADPQVCGLLVTKTLLPPGLRQVLGQLDEAGRTRYHRAILDFVRHALLVDESGAQG
ncbi:helix-turn-helix domain-containing protein [Mycolicibacter sp. MYC340]|uniref:Helix-turn-helix domain-containing protein n=1 Tax=[Mycobacterium] nativiensis TaxID=2855503 RepID=A0ABU5XVH4_9MYCO|nr:TetR/AcrR family transcriptional regulator [Mycolicibacter sp. MYC340]MEB3031979.1 helix-turn-helix domain-containing protein [Mycolicibacter sp. MYC340]